MSEYKEMEFDELPPKSKHVVISNKEFDDIILKNIDIQRGILDNLGLKNTKFQNCRITQSVIKDCYLRKAEFTDVDFTGSKFINCNLEMVKFKSCNFRYATFSGCRINIPEILGSLPSEPNLLKGILRELRRNEEDMGNRRTADFILLKEIDAERKLFVEEFCVRTSYFEEKATNKSRLRALIKYLLSHLDDKIWGHGLKLGRLIVSGLFMILIFATLIFILKQPYKISTPDIVSLNIGQALYLSVLSFSNLGYGEYIPLTTLGKILLGVESLLGAIFIGFIAAAVYRRIAR